MKIRGVDWHCFLFGHMEDFLTLRCRLCDADLAPPLTAETLYRAIRALEGREL